MTEKFEKWGRIRVKGKWDFIIKYGFLLWGLGTAVLFSLVVSFMQWEASFLSISKESSGALSTGRDWLGDDHMVRQRELIQEACFFKM